MWYRFDIISIIQRKIKKGTEVPLNYLMSVDSTDEYDNSVTGRVCPSGRQENTHRRRMLLDPQRYSSGPDRSPNIYLLHRDDGSWYIPDPFISGLGFYSCAGTSCTDRKYKYREDYYYETCNGTPTSRITEFEAPLSYGTFRSPGEIEADAYGTTFSKHVEYIMPGATYSTTIVWDVTVRLLDGQDLTVERLEVTQGLQDVANTIPLVRGRRTIVRAFLGKGSYIGPIPGVTGVLRAYSGGTLLGEVPDPVGLVGEEDRALGAAEVHLGGMAGGGPAGDSLVPVLPPAERSRGQPVGSRRRVTYQPGLSIGWTGKGLARSSPGKRLEGDVSIMAYACRPRPAPHFS